MAPANSPTLRFGWLICLIAAAVYCVWLGVHWLPLDYSDKELAAFVSRVWDVQQQLRAGQGLPWWTPYYMSGSSYGLNHSQGFYLVPSLFFARFVSLHVAVKLTALLAIFASAVAMYCCARHFLKNDWAATLAALAFLLHPQQIIRAAGAEHLGISVFMPFMPLSFWLLARALETARWRDAFWCALALVGLLWTHNKMAFVHGVFLAGYIVYWFWPAERRRAWQKPARTLGWIAVLTALLGAPILLPGLLEARYVKLLSGEADLLKGWQRNYAFKSLLALVDRDAILTRQAVDGVMKVVQNLGGVRSQDELQQVQWVIGLQADAPEKYAGIVMLAVLATTALFNDRRVNRRLFWLLVGFVLLSLMLATGPTNVLEAHWTTFTALTSLDGVPGSVTVAVWLCLLVTGAFLVLFYRRKLTTLPKRLVAAGAFVLFLVLPAFPLLAQVPFFKEVRAPFVFYDGPGSFFMALLVGFFITDVVKRRDPLVVCAVAVLLVVDYWPYQKPAKDNGVPARTLANLRTSYGKLRNDADWVKTYSLSGRYFHLLGPMYGGKPQVWEAFYNWMAPLGMGVLNNSAWSSLQHHRAFLNLVGARYVVFDKTDPSNTGPQSQQILAAYRQMFPAVAVENEDFVVFRNDFAREYLTAYRRAYLQPGDFRQAGPTVLALAARDWPVVHEAVGEVERNMPPGPGPRVTLGDVQLSRLNNGTIRITATAPEACLAVIAESYYPYWYATLNGQPARVVRVSCGLIGLWLPAGTHQIVLRYQSPRLYFLGAIVSVLSLVIGLGTVAFATRRSSRAGRCPA